MPELRPVRLRDLIEINHGFAFKGEYFSESEPGILLITPGNFARGGGFQTTKPKYYSGPVPDGYTLEPGDLVVTMTDLSKAGDTLGYPALVPPSPIFLHNQRIGLVKLLDQNRVDKRYLYYELKRESYRSHVLAGATGSTVRHTSPGRILDYEFLLPSLARQQAVGEVLGALDDKIAVNERIVATAWALAEAYFIGTQAAETDVVRLDILVDLCYGKALKEEDRTTGQVPVFGGNGRSGWHDTALVEGPGVIVGRKGANAGSVSWSQGRFWPIDTAFYVKPTRPDLPLEFLLFLLAKANLRKIVGDSAIPGLNRNMALACEVRIPKQQEIEAFVGRARPLLRLAHGRAQENQALAELRDALLPKLMSGELRIRDAERQVEEAT